MEESAQYYLQVVPSGESPVWPVPATDLVVGSQEVEGGFTQYWAYPKSTGTLISELPHAQRLASQISTPKPVILIDQPSENLLELVLVKGGVAFAKTDSNITNLEDNLSEILDYGKNRFNIKIDNFMTTSRVTPDVEQKLDDLEGTENVSEAAGEKVDGPEEENVIPNDNEEQDLANASSPIPTEVEGSEDSSNAPIFPDSKMNESDTFTNLRGVDPTKVFRSEPTLGGLPANRKKSSNLVTWILIVILLGGLGAGGYLFRSKLTAMFNGSKDTTKDLTASASPTPTPEATPVPLVKSEYSLRVLNGTTTTGLAADLSDKLKQLGWTMLPVGNSADKKVAQTTVKVKEGQDRLAEEIIKDLASDYEASRGADLKDSDTADAEVVIGKK